MRGSVIALLSIVMAVGSTLVIHSAADGGAGHADSARESEIVFAPSPRFPVAREEAELAFKISRDGAPDKGLSVTVTLVRVEDDGHGDADTDVHGIEKDQPAKAPDTYGEGKVEPTRPMDMPGSMKSEPAKGMDMQAEEKAEPTKAVDAHTESAREEISPVNLSTVEESPGVYVARYTFHQGGKYEISAGMGEERAGFVLGVRSAPVAWPLVMGLAASVAISAGAVAAIKTARKEW